MRFVTAFARIEATVLAVGLFFVDGRFVFAVSFYRLCLYQQVGLQPSMFVVDEIDADNISNFLRNEKKFVKIVLAAFPLIFLIAIAGAFSWQKAEKDMYNATVGITFIKLF